jgi:hypothetical protein
MVFLSFCRENGIPHDQTQWMEQAERDLFVPTCLEMVEFFVLGGW